MGRKGRTGDEGPGPASCDTRRTVATMHVTVFGASKPVPGDPAYEDGVRLGRAVGALGHVVVTGGYGGVMEAVSRGAAEAGGHVIGVTTPTAFPDRPGANPWVREEVVTPDLPTRIRTLIALGDVALALPGSIGTFAEIVLLWNANFVTTFSGRPPTPLLAVGPLWARVLPDLEALLETEPGHVEWAEAVDDAIQWLSRRP